MVSFDHEMLVDLFRKQGRLAVELLRACAHIKLDHDSVTHDSFDLSQVAPTGYFADAVVVLRDGAARPVTGVIVEVQRDEDRHKLRSWPAYVANLRAKLDCSAMLLVLAPDPAVAAWARQPIELGHPGFCLTPIVVGFDDVPRVRDRGLASQLPQLAVLSAMAHPELEIAEVAIEAIAPLPEDEARLYLDVVIAALPESLRQSLEGRMHRYEYKSDFARNYYGQGRQEGLQAGRQEGLQAGLQAGRQEGLQAGRQEALQAAAVALARAKIKALSAADVAAIEGAFDLDVLTGLVTALGKARSAASARVVLDRVLAR